LPQIETVYICNHTHTDIGFTDYQDVCFSQHAESYGQALDLIEATDDYPEEARYRWTCETTGPLVRWLRGASPKEVERFLAWHRAGRIDVAGMQYNFTPLLDVEQMHGSLYPLRALRDDYGIDVEAAMQDDVNGVSWLFADLLADVVGITLYTAAVNPIRGARPKPFPGAFWWEGPSGKKVLAWNGFHDLFGRSQARVGDCDLVDRLLPRWLEQLEKDPDYPYGLFWFLLIYSGTVFPFQMYLMPLFDTFLRLGIYDTRMGLTGFYIAIAIPFAVFVMRGFFLTVPWEIQEAANIEGANTWQTFWQVMMPMAKAPMVMLMLIQFTWIWNDLLFGLVLTRSTSVRPINVALIGMQGLYGQSDGPSIIAATLIASAPTLILFLLLQRYFIRGLTLGTVGE
jgi:hypothetical protein